jgi:hypothetical protein
MVLTQIVWTLMADLLFHMHRDLGAVQILADKGAHMNLVDKDGQSALSFTAV